MEKLFAIASKIFRSIRAIRPKGFSLSLEQYRDLHECIQNLSVASQANSRAIGSLIETDKSLFAFAKQLETRIKAYEEALELLKQINAARAK